MKYNTNGQAIPDQTIFMEKEDFKASEDTKIYWLGNADAMINAHGTWTQNV